jgi:hypothetical protein
LIFSIRIVILEVIDAGNLPATSDVGKSMQLVRVKEDAAAAVHTWMDEMSAGNRGDVLHKGFRSVERILSDLSTHLTFGADHGDPVTHPIVADFN